MNKREQGALFETYALEFFKSQGYSFVARNYFTKYGEIDLIVQRDNLMVFAEVKQRTTDIFGQGEYAVSYKKRKKIYLSAGEYLSKNRCFNCDIRFDAVIFNGRSTKPCNWIKNMIWGDEFGF